MQARAARDAQPRPAEPEARVTASRGVALGVMAFKILGAGTQNVWMREAVRDGLNTQLSGLSSVKVYSKEYLDFLMTRQGLSEIEVADKLGITKMLTGSVIAVGDTLRVETHVVDVASGVLESSYAAAGHTGDFLALQSQVVLGVIARLHLPLTEAERARLEARRSTNVEALRLLLEAEGAALGAAREPTPEPPAPEHHSALPSCWTIAARFLASPAHASEEGDDGILALIESYRRAIEAEDLQALVAIYADFAPEQEAALRRYFDNVRDLRVEIDNVDFVVIGDEAVVSYTRTDDFTDVRTGRNMHLAVRLTKTLRRHEGDWKFVREP